MGEGLKLRWDDLKWASTKEYDEILWIGFNWHRKWSTAGYCDNGNEQ